MWFLPVAPNAATTFNRLKNPNLRPPPLAPMPTQAMSVTVSALERKVIDHADHDVSQLDQPGGALTKARDAMARGRMRPAKRWAWRAANVAARTNDREALEAVGAIASTIRERSTGATRRQADMLVSYCAAALDNPRSRSGVFDRLFSSIATTRPTRRRFR